MAGIDWRGPNFDGEFFEKFVGCLLGNRFPTAVRVRPAQGDGGIDIFVYVDESEVDVYQLKHFPDKIHWDQVTGSLAHLQSGKWRGRRVREWHLVIPQQPTTSSNPDLQTTWAKFEEVVEPLPFPCRWFGEDRLHDLAAEFPHVREYYLGDGKESLLRLAGDWHNVTAQIAAEQPPSPDVISEKLSQMADALDRGDPHFSYALEISPVEPMAFDRRALSHTTTYLNGRFFTQSVFERYRGAAVHAQDRVEAQMLLREGPASAALQQAVDFGGFEAITFGPEDLVEFNPPAMGRVMEFGGSEGLHVQVTPFVEPNPPSDLIVLIAGQDGKKVSFPFKGEGISRGKIGQTARWTSPGERLFIELELDSNDHTTRIFVQPNGSFAGLPTRTFGSDASFFAEMAYGKTMTLLTSLRDKIADIDLVENRPIKPIDAGIVIGLLTLQRETSQELAFPEELEPAEALELVHFASLLRGHLVTQRITSCFGTFESDEDVPQLDSPFATTFAKSLEQLTLFGQTFTLREQVGLATMAKASHVGEIVVQEDGTAVAEFVVGSHDVSVSRRLHPKDIDPQFPTDELVQELAVVKEHKAAESLLEEFIGAWLADPW